MAAPNGNGRERLDLKVAGQSFGLTATSLIPSLALIILGVALYVVWLAQDARFAAMDARFAQMQEQHVRMYDGQLRQNALAHDYLETVRKWLQVLQYNLNQESGQRLPLDVAPPLPPSDAPKAPPP